MWKLLQKISSNLVIAIPAAIALGFVYGLFFDSSFLKAFIVPLTFIMVYPMMINLNWKKLASGGDGKVILTAQLLNFVFLPLSGFIIGILFFKNNPYMALGVFLASLFPTSGMTITWTGFSRGNVEAAVKMTLIGLSLGSLLAPFYLKFFMGKVIPINLLEIFRQVFIIIILPLIAGYITRKAFVAVLGEENFRKSWGQRFPSISTLGVLGIVFVAMALKSKAIAAKPLELLYAVIPLLVLYSLNILVATFIGKRYLKREDGIAMVFGTVARNLSIALAVAINAFGEKGADAALVLSAGFIIQSQAMAWYSKLAQRIFSENSNEELRRVAESAKA
jgi:ACR3 family arsenite efflux pump ArsB